MTSVPTNRQPAHALRLSLGLCIALAGCAAQQDLRDDFADGEEPVRTTWSVLDSTANTFGPNAGSEDVALGFEIAPATAASNSAAPQAPRFTPGWYFLAGLGSVCADSSSLDFDEMDVGFHAAAGYRFLRYLGAEAGYVNFGKQDYDLDGGANDGQIETDGFHLSAIGYYPIYSIFEAMARVGVMGWSEDDRTFGGGTTGDDGADLFFGIGVQANIHGHWGARLEWTRLEKNGDGTDFNNVMLSAIWTL